MVIARLCLGFSLVSLSTSFLSTLVFSPSVNLALFLFLSIFPRPDQVRKKKNFVYLSFVLLFFFLNHYNFLFLL